MGFGPGAWGVIVIWITVLSSSCRMMAVLRGNTADMSGQRIYPTNQRLSE